LKVSVIVKAIGPAAIVVVMGQIIPLSGQEMWLVDNGKAEKPSSHQALRRSFRTS
jgi:hypothetical protein